MYEWLSHLLTQVQVYFRMQTEQTILSVFKWQRESCELVYIHSDSLKLGGSFQLSVCCSGAEEPAPYQGNMGAELAAGVLFKVQVRL